MRFECFQRYLTLKPVREWTWKEYQIETDGVLRTQRKAPYVGHGKDRDTIFKFRHSRPVTAMPPEYYHQSRRLIPPDEPDMETGCCQGMEYLILRSGYGTFCGYIQLPKSAPTADSNQSEYEQLTDHYLDYFDGRVVGFTNLKLDSHVPLNEGRLSKSRPNHQVDQKYICLDRTFEYIQKFSKILQDYIGEQP